MDYPHDLCGVAHGCHARTPSVGYSQTVYTDTHMHVHARLCVVHRVVLPPLSPSPSVWRESLPKSELRWRRQITQADCRTPSIQKAERRWTQGVCFFMRERGREWEWEASSRQKRKVLIKGNNTKNYAKESAVKQRALLLSPQTHTLTYKEVRKTKSKEYVCLLLRVKSTCKHQRKGKQK
jgi:hypothetical protein